MADSTPTGSVVFRRLWGMLRPEWSWIGVALVLLVVSMPGELFPAFIWGYIVDEIIVRHTAGSGFMAFMISLHGRIADLYWLLFSAVAWMFVVYVVSLTASTLSTVILQRAAQKFVFRLRNKVYHKLQSQSLGYLQRQRTGDLISRAMGDVDELQNFVVNSIDLIIGDGGLWLATVAIVLYMSWQVAGSSLAPLLIVYFMLRYFNAKVRPIYAAARQAAGDVTNRLQENLSGVTVIKIFNREPQEAKRFEEVTDAYYRQQMRAITARNLFFPFTNAVGFFSNVFMIGVGGYLLLRYPHGRFTIGTLIIFRAYWWRLFGPVQTLARVNDLIQRARAAGGRVFEVLDAPEELPDAPGAVAIEHVRGAMHVRNVSFRYPADSPDKIQPLVLHDVDVRIEPGQTVALCGPSGSGKSTILNLLLRFYDPAEGEVLLDGRDIRSVKRESFRRHVALVQQESFLFNDSVLDNIRYGHGEATMDQVIAAATAANAHEFIAHLPNGYDTKVGERGVRLSGGQKQRISIARAFLANPTLLLLDEPTSSVEPDSEATIIAALDRLMAGRTTVLTSHRPSLIGQADVVYILDHGRVTDHGRPRELMERNTWFSRFMRSSEDALV
jgi:ABC-type multidrug transport system fused ATPase/permease subunit